MRRPFPILLLAVVVGVLTWNCNGNLPGSNQLSASAGNNQSTVVNTAFATQLQAQLINGFKPLGAQIGIPGQQVTFTITPDPVSGAGGTFANGTLTDVEMTAAVTAGGLSTGIATSTTITANGKAGQFKVVASVPSTVAAIPATFMLTNTPATAAAIKATGGTPQSASISTAFGTSLQATVTDNQGNLVSGVSVLFTAPSTGASGTFANGLATETDITSAKGVASSTVFTANATAGAYSVIASTQGVSPSATFALTNATAQPAQIVPGPPQSTSINSAFPALLTATVKDSSGNALSGFSVTFTAPSTGASGLFANGLTTETDISGANGVATTSVFTANAVLGSYQVTAAVASGSPSTTISLTNAPASNVVPALRYVFEINQSAVSVYAVWPSTGQLRSMSYFVPSDYNAFGSAPAGAIHPNGKVLYVTIAGLSIGSSLWTLEAGQNGILTQEAFASFPNSFQYLACDPLGRFLYASDSIGGTINVLALDPTKGIPGSPAPALSGGITNPTELVIDPTGSYLFALNSLSSVFMYHIDATSGALSLVGTSQNVGTNNSSLTLSPNGANLYVLSGNLIYAFSVDPTSGLTPLQTSPFSLPASNFAKSAAVDPSGKYLYVTAQGSDGLYGFSIGSSGALAPLPSSSFAVGNSPYQINLDPSGHYVYVTNQLDAWVYSADSTTGALTPVSQIRTMGTIGSEAQLLSTGSSPLTFTPTALYVANSGSNNISEFKIDSSSGALTDGSLVGAGANPMAVAVLPNGNFAYAANSALSSGAPTLSAYSISSEVLSPLGNPVPSGLGPTWLTPDLSGSFLYSVNQSDYSVWNFTISSGALTSGAKAASTGASPVFISTDPTGQYLYTANFLGESIGQYAIVLPQGSLTAINSDISGGGSGTSSIAVDPSGRFLYAANMNGSTMGTVGEFKIGAGTGILGSATSQTLFVGKASSSVVVEPSGKYAFVSDFVLNKIFSFTIDPSTGLLTLSSAAQPVASTGTGPVALAVDISGQYLYCVNSGSNDIGIFKINLNDGSLTQVGTTTVPTGGTTPAGIALTGTVN